MSVSNEPGSTYTIHIGRGISDPVLFKTSVEQHETALQQAYDRNEQIETTERLARLVNDMEWARHHHPGTSLTYMDVESVRLYLQGIRQENDARP